MQESLQKCQQKSQRTLPFEQERNTQTSVLEEVLLSIIETLTQLEYLRQRKVLLYMGEDRAPFPKLLDEEDATILYEGLRNHARLDRLDLVINTSGGNVTAVRKLLQILHAATAHLTILVPYKARSAGTILCLGAHSVVLTPLAELSPIDPQMKGVGIQVGRPAQLSSEDIVSFRAMAQHWFDIRGEEHALSLLKILCERMFPPSLTQFFRAEQLVRQVALEALCFQLPDAHAQARQHIVDQLINGYADHSYPLTCSDLRELGLQVAEALPEEERLLWSLWKQSRAYLEISQNALGPGHDSSHVDGIFLSTDFRARHLVQMGFLLPPEQEQDMQITRTIHHSHWEILDGYSRIE